MGKRDGKVATITGAGGGIGRPLANENEQGRPSEQSNSFL